MKKVFLAIRIMKKQRVLNVILCLEFALALVMFSVLINRVEYNSKAINVIEKANIDNSINFVGRFSQPIVNEGELEILEDLSYLDDLNQYIKELPEIEGVSDIQEHSFINESSNTDYEFTTYDEITAEKFRAPLKAGKWFTDVDREDNIIPVVVLDTTNNADTYKIGEFFGANERIWDSEGNGIIAQEEFQFVVVGIVDRNNSLVFYPTGSRNYIETFDALFLEIQENTQTFLCETVNGLGTKTQIRSNFMIYLKESTSKLRIESIAKEMERYGYLNVIADMKQETNNILSYRMKMDFPIFFSLLAISMIGLISLSFLNAKKQRKNFAIYSLCGGKKNDSFIIYFLYFMFIMGTSFLLYILLMRFSYMSDERGLFYLYLISNKTASYSVMVCSIICLISTWLPFNLMKKSSVIRNYKIN